MALVSVELPRAEIILVSLAALGRNLSPRSPLLVALSEMTEDFELHHSGERAVTILSKMPSHWWNGPVGAKAIRILIEQLGGIDCLSLEEQLSVDVTMHMHPMAHWLDAEGIQKGLSAWLSQNWMHDPQTVLRGLNQTDKIVVRDAARAGVFRQSCIPETALCRAIFAWPSEHQKGPCKIKELISMFVAEGADDPQMEEERASFPIFLSFHGSARVITDCSASTSVYTLKATIAGQTGVPEIQQRLIFQGRVLSDSMRLGPIGVRRDSTVYLKVDQARDSGFPIFVSRVRDEVKETLVIEDCSASTSVYTLKAKIAGQTSDPEIHQRLVFNGRELSDSMRLGPIGVRGDSTVYLIVDQSLESSFPIFVSRVRDKFREKLVVEDCFASTTVYDLKTILTDKTYIPETHQRLVFGGAELSDSMRLGPAGVRRDSNVYLVVSPTF